MSYHTEIFNKFEMAQSEVNFVNSVHGNTGNIISYADGHQILSNFYLAKQIEQSSKSSDKSAKVMTGLTWAIVFFTAMQAISAIISLL